MFFINFLQNQKLNNLKNKFFLRKKAFSLLESVAVIIIIGILLAGLMVGKNIMKKARISSAKSLTNSSPIHSIKNNILWIESSYAEKSLEEGLDDGSAIKKWNDNSINKSQISISSVGSGPTYANTINDIPAVKFDSSSSGNYLTIEDAKFLNNTDYTIFILDKRIGNNSGINNYLIGNGTSFALGYQSDVKIIQSHGEGASSTNQASIESLSNYSGPRVLTFTHSSIDGNSIYINATLANQNTSSQAKAHVNGLTSLVLGKGYNGEIGEVIIFSRNLKAKEREDIEDYLVQKWYVPNNRGISSSCTNGIVTSKGCDASCAVSIPGVSTTSVIDGVSGTFTCSGTGYNSSDTISYSCSNGTLSSSGSCSCASGYILSAGSCVQGCLVATIAGTSYSGSTVSPGTAVTCNLPNYSGATLGTCSAGNPINGNCGCASGYVLSSGSCIAGCNVATIAGTSHSGSVVSPGTVVTCDSPNYDGSTLGTCASGNTITGSCGCVSGYNIDGGACKQKCSISAATINVGSNVTVNSGSSSYNCSGSGSGYLGTITYTCNNGSLSSVSGTCTFNDLYAVLTSGSSYSIPSGVGYAHAKIWAIGGGGGGHGMSGSSASATGGGAGGVAYKTWSISGGETISYSIGASGSGGIGNNNGADGGNTSVTLSSATIQGNGGKGGLGSGISSGGTYSGGDGGSNGGSSPNSTHIDTGSTGGGAVGGSNGGSNSGNLGGSGANSSDVSGLFTALTSAGYPKTSGGVGGIGTQPTPSFTAHGGNASGFGCGGGGGGAWGGNGGKGLYGGGGGGGAGEGSTPLNGGSGGVGAVVIKLTN